MREFPSPSHEPVYKYFVRGNYGYYLRADCTPHHDDDDHHDDRAEARCSRSPPLEPRPGLTVPSRAPKAPPPVGPLVGSPLATRVSELLTIDEALALVLERVRRSRHEEVELERPPAACSPSPRCALVDLPPFPSSAMDGFALRAADAPGALPGRRTDRGRPAGRPCARSRRGDGDRDRRRRAGGRRHCRPDRGRRGPRHRGSRSAPLARARTSATAAAISRRRPRRAGRCPARRRSTWARSRPPA